MRILIAEDERRLAGAIARGLRRGGRGVDITHDGASALVKARVVDYDVVVLDRDLPELHGDEVCRLLSTDERETKVLMLTAADSTDDLVDGLALGADDYLPKPFHWPELVPRIRALAPRPGPRRGRAGRAGPARRSSATTTSSSTPAAARRGGASSRSTSRRRSSASSRPCSRPAGRRGRRRRR